MSSVIVARNGPVTVVTIDRVAVRNAVDRATAAELAAAFRAFEADAGARVAVLTGAGGTFCAGADLHAIAAGDGNRLEPDGDGPMGPTRLTLTKPVIAAVEGHAVGGGFELALWCDLRIAASDAVFGFFNRKWGVPLIDGGTVRLPRLVGAGRAADLVLTGRPLGAAEALSWGVANRVVPSGEARAHAVALGHEIAAHPPAALTGDFASLKQQHALPLDAALAAEFEAGAAALAAEAVPGAERFRDRARSKRSGP